MRPSPQHKRALAGPAVLICVGVALASPARAQTLQQEMANAYASNPQIRGSRAQLDATAENVPQALSGWRPTVTITASGGPIQLDSFTRTTAGNVVGTNYFHTQLYQAAITQPLYSGGQTVARTAQADHLFAAAQWQLVSAEETVLSAVAIDYADVLRDQAIVDFNAKNVRFLAHELQRSRARIQAGEVTQTDVSQSEGYYAAGQASLKQAEATLATSRANYLRDIGHPPGRLTLPHIRFDIPKDRDTAVDETMSDNPDLLAAKESTLASKDNVDAVRSQLLPQISAQAGVQRTNDLNIEGQELTAKTIKLQMTMPLYEAGAIYSQTRQAMRNVAVQRSQVDTTQRTAVDAVGAAWDTLDQIRGVVTALREATRADAKTLEGMIAENAVGVRTVFDVLNAQQTLFQAQVALAQAVATEFTAQVQIAQSVGRLTAASLKLPVAPYNPNAYMNAVRDKWIGFYPANEDDFSAPGPTIGPEAAPRPAK